ncbi:MAG: hypothetical protein KatS3mg105_5025 [Gemmatales bacterium]|nr:MAG: hypothetical protein KatS3mg105_5025 [Gemmatales bacterium]
MLVAVRSRGGRVVLPNNATNVSTDFIGTNSLDSSLAGTLNGRTKIKTLRFQAAGSTVDNLIKVYRKDGSGNKTLVLKVFVPSNTPNVSEKRPVWTATFKNLDIMLFSTSHVLSYQLHVVPGSEIIIDEEAIDYE